MRADALLVCERGARPGGLALHPSQGALQPRLELSRAGPRVGRRPHRQLPAAHRHDTDGRTHLRGGADPSTPSALTTFLATATLSSTALAAATLTATSMTTTTTSLQVLRLDRADMLAVAMMHPVVEARIKRAAVR